MQSSNDKHLSDFLNGKSPHTVDLFNQLVNEFQQVGEVKVYPLKSMIAFGARTKFAYVIQLGKNFMDVVFPFKQAYTDNMCFNKIKPVPGSDDFNHHLRIYFKEDINDEVKFYMRLAWSKQFVKFNRNFNEILRMINSGVNTSSAMPLLPWPPGGIPGGGPPFGGGPPPGILPSGELFGGPGIPGPGGGPPPAPACYIYLVVQYRTAYTVACHIKAGSFCPLVQCCRVQVINVFLRAVRFGIGSPFAADIIYFVAQVYRSPAAGAHWQFCGKGTPFPGFKIITVHIQHHLPEKRYFIFRVAVAGVTARLRHIAYRRSPPPCCDRGYAERRAALSSYW